MRLSTTPGLFIETLRTFNDILDRHGDREPYKQLLELCRDRLSGQDLTVVIYRGEPDIEVDHFTVRFESDRFQMTGRGSQSGGIMLRLPYDVLEEVVDNQERYRENPDLMDWSWLAQLPGFDEREQNDQ